MFTLPMYYAIHRAIYEGNLIDPYSNNYGQWLRYRVGKKERNLTDLYKAVFDKDWEVAQKILNERF